MGYYRMEIRAATRADIIELCGEPYRESIRALVVEHEDRPIGIVGVIHREPMQCFSVVLDELRKSPRSIVKVVKPLRVILDGYMGEIYAIADGDVDSSSRFLEYIGFNHFQTTSQGRIYKWPKQSPS